MDWLGDNLWAAWLSVAILLGIAEIASLDMVLVMLAVGALGGMLTSVVTDSIAAQVLVSVAVAVAMLGVVRPGLARRLHQGPDLVLGKDGLIGARTTALGAITGTAPGQIRLEGVIWTAQPYDDTMVIEAGSTVEVLEIRGATAYVHPVPSLES